MIDRQQLRAQLSAHEGRKKFVYDDCTGKPIGEGTFVRGLPTVGVGRNLADRGLSDDEIDYLLDHDINDCIADAMKFGWFEGLDPVRRAVITELVFNMGLARLNGFKKFLAAMSEHNWQQAAEELKDSHWYAQVGARADRLIKQLTTGEWQPL
jgi:lysozyme